jgi:hypothetical protein
VYNTSAKGKMPKKAQWEGKMIDKTDDDFDLDTQVNFEFSSEIAQGEAMTLGPNPDCKGF